MGPGVRRDDGARARRAPERRLIHQVETPLGYFACRLTSGEGLLTFSMMVRRRAAFATVLVLALAPAFADPSFAAGALAVGKCGAYGQAIDYPAEGPALAAARKQCKGDCKTVTMKRACAAFAVDMTNPCGAHGYAVKPQISNSLNEATKKCYDFGGKECVIRAWACDARG